jgi:hypothetical protein
MTTVAEELVLTKRELMKVKKALADQVKINEDIGPYIIELTKIVNAIIETLPDKSKAYVNSKKNTDDYITTYRAIYNTGQDLKTEIDDVKKLNSN